MGEAGGRGGAEGKVAGVSVDGVGRVRLELEALRLDGLPTADGAGVDPGAEGGLEGEGEGDGKGEGEGAAGGGDEGAAEVVATAGTRSAEVGRHVEKVPLLFLHGLSEHIMNFFLIL